MNAEGQFDIRLIMLPPGYCNYRCTFCHQEGLADVRRRQAPQALAPEELTDLVLSLLPCGLAGITVSGGEPLLQTKLVIAFLRTLPPLPVTIVSNGTLLSRFLPHALQCPQISWRFNINLPSFDPTVFRILTGQCHIEPSRIVSQVQSAVGHGFEVNLSCVLCPPRNDSSESLRSYIMHASKNGVSNVRFLVQPNADLHGYLDSALNLGTPLSVRRAGRVRRYQWHTDLGIEIVQCENPEVERSGLDVGDIYLTTRRTVKLGLWGEETPFTDLDHLRTLVGRYLRPGDGQDGPPARAFPPSHRLPTPFAG